MKWSQGDVRLVRRGHYPRGGGEVVLMVRPSELRAVNTLEFGNLVEIRVLTHAVRLPAYIARGQADSARNTLIKAGIKVPIEISLETYEQGEDPHLGPGSGIALWARSDKGYVKGSN